MLETQKRDYFFWAILTTTYEMDRTKKLSFLYIADSIVYALYYFHAFFAI